MITKISLYKIIVSKLIMKKIAYLAIFIIPAILILTGIWWGLPNYDAWEPDCIAPIGPLAASATLFSEGPYSQYPLFHYILSALFYAPYVFYMVAINAIPFPPDPIYPYGVKNALTHFSALILISRLISAAMGFSILIIVYKLASKFFDSRAALFSVLLCSLGYIFIYYSHTANVDIPYTFWAFLSIYFYVLLIEKPKIKYCILSSIFAALSLCTKDQAYGFFLLAPFAAFLLLWSRLKKNTFIYLVASIFTFTAVFIFANNLIFNFSGFIEHLNMNNWFFSNAKDVLMRR